MVIRCERCSTLYELDEALLAPSGSQVQCTRCQHVFTAFPPRAAGRTLVGVPAQTASEPARGAGRTLAGVPAQGASEPGARREEREAAPPPPPPAPAPAAAPPARAEPRVARSGPPPVYRPSAAAALPTSGRAPLLRRDSVGAFENRLRRSARWRWLAPLLGVLVAIGGASAWWLLARKSPPDASRVKSDAFSLVARDDAASMEQGITRLDALLRRNPEHRSAASDRSLAYLLRAMALVDEGESVAARLAARTAERERLRRVQPEGWEDAERAVASEIMKLEAEVKGHEERARSLGAAAFQGLRRLQSEEGDVPEVTRGLAAYYALGGDRDRARATLRVAREKAPADPWLDLVEAWTDLRDPDRSARERALVQLGALSTARPELLRARYLLARAQASLGRQGHAIATLDALLAANAQHEAGKRLREELSVPSAPLAPAPAPVATPVPHQRKLVTNSEPSAPPEAGVAAPPGGAPAASERPTPRPARRRASAPAAVVPPPEEVPAAPAEPAAEAAPAPPVPPAGAGTVGVPTPKPEPRREWGPPATMDGG